MKKKKEKARKIKEKIFKYDNYIQILLGMLFREVKEDSEEDQCLTQLLMRNFKTFENYSEFVLNDSHKTKKLACKSDDFDFSLELSLILGGKDKGNSLPHLKFKYLNYSDYDVTNLTFIFIEPEGIVICYVL